MSEVIKKYKYVTDAIIGKTKQDFEPIFEEIIAPIYLFQAQQGENIPSKYKIVNRETGEEIMSLEEATKITSFLRYGRQV